MKKQPFRQVLFSVLIWPLLEVPSLHFFCGKRLSAFIDGGKDVLYDFLKRQDINWRGFRLYIALQLIRQHNLGSEPIRAAIVDDTIKHRRGKKVSAVSSHFDHMLGKQVIGQQMLEMGLATPKGYVPLDSRIYVSEKRIQDGKS
ncbi:MAG: transposase, partial [Deltaproteobacteria bacterium]|nr:transposase [Deltaproteobacteria bacterium]